MIPFIKAHACGNDFLIVIEEAAAGYDKEELTRALCERNTGVGADGVEYFRWSNDHSGRIRLHNADGSIAEISGNGTRCVAAWMAQETGAQPGDELTIETDAGTRVCTIQEFRSSAIVGPTIMITTDMDIPEIEERTVELADGTTIQGVAVSMGNPHFVIVMPASGADLLGGGYPLDASERALAALDFSIGGRSWEEIGEEICFHPDFPDQTNVEFVHILGSQSEPIQQVALRIFERGVGPTSSSGTGSSATAAAMIAVHHADREIEVIAPGGAQTVRWQGIGEKLYLTGPATLVARGEFWSGDSL
ncbi:MAG TPA: diaminopimelate epimerase [Terracidiphilus sp.]|nr:diaminopimelate epimerase [Terracidiphilus sp.]